LLTITAADFANLSLLESPELARRLERARIVPLEGIPAHVVTMYSRALCADVRTGVRRVVRLIYPDDRPAGAGDICVVTPAGLALLGARAGNEIQWQLEDGTVHRVKVEAVLYQPEQDLRTNLL
jgi:regulator of nucleoside diphosphate kinase